MGQELAIIRSRVTYSREDKETDGAQGIFEAVKLFCQTL